MRLERGVVVEDHAGATAVGPAGDPFERASLALESAGIRWCRLRERDVAAVEDDVLVEPADLRRARRALAEVGFHERRHLGRGSHRMFYAYHEASGRWAKLDVVTAVHLGRWQEWPTPFGGWCLARRTVAPGDPRPSPDDEFWSLLLHELLDRRFAGLRHPDRLRELAGQARADSDGASFFARIVGRAWPPERIIALATAPVEADLNELAARSRAGLRGWPGLATRSRRIRAALLRRLDRLEPPFLRRGLTVALMGPDGAGKSTLASVIGIDAPMATRRIYLGLYGGARRVSGGRPRQRRRVRGIDTLGRLFAMWRGGLAGWWHVRRGRLVLFDRHPYDARSAGDARGLARLRRAILARSLPAPDLVIILDAPAELLVGRKSEHPVEAIERQRTGYRALAARIPQAVVVDASEGLDLVARRATTLIAAAMAARSTGR